MKERREITFYCLLVTTVPYSPTHVNEINYINFLKIIFCHFRYLCRSDGTSKNTRIMSSTSIKASTIVQDIVKLEKEVADISFLKQGLYYYYGSLKHQKEFYYFGVEKHLMGPSDAFFFLF